MATGINKVNNTENLAPGSYPYMLNAARQWLGRFAENRMAMAGLIFITFILLVAAFAPYIAIHDPDDINIKNRLAPLSWLHPFGTDAFGRDIFSRVVYGARISAIAGIGSVSISLFLGVFLGAFAGYSGRVIDNCIMRLMDAIMAFPGILFAIALMAVMGASLTNVCIALAIRYTPHFARIARGAVLKEREKEYVEAAVVQGESNFRILFRQIMPNCTAPILVQMTLDFAHAIIAEASLSFLGVGVPPPSPSWGNILHAARTTMEFYPWGAIFPGLAICFSVLGLNLLGDGLRDVLDPRLSEERGSNG